MSTMSFQPLIVVILLIFLVLMAFSVFLWFLISPSVATDITKKPKVKKENDAKRKPKTNSRPRPNPALRAKSEPVRQSAAIHPKKMIKKQEAKPKIDKKPDLKYIEIRPEPIKRNKLQKTKTKAEPYDSKDSGQSRDNFRGLNASKVEKPKKIDAFDSFVEASKRLD